MKKKLLYSLPILTSVVSLALTLTVLYMLFAPYKILEIEEPIKILNNPVKAGDYISYQAHYKKYAGIAGHVTEQLVDTVGIAFNEYNSNLPVGEHTIINSGFKIPLYTPPGKYHLVATVRYQVNPIRTIEYYVVSENFEVIK